MVGGAFLLFFCHPLIYKKKWVRILVHILVRVCDIFIITSCYICVQAQIYWNRFPHQKWTFCNSPRTYRKETKFTSTEILFGETTHVDGKEGRKDSREFPGQMAENCFSFSEDCHPCETLPEGYIISTHPSPEQWGKHPPQTSMLIISFKASVHAIWFKRQICKNEKPPISLHDFQNKS